MIRTMGWFGSDVLDFVTGKAGDVVDSLETFAANIPGAPALAKALTGPVRDFANTAPGRILFSAIATSLTGGLAPILGPQLATVAWSLPGLARGQDFVTAWSQEFSSRVKDAAAIVGGPTVGDLLAPQLQQLSEYIAANGGDLSQIVDLSDVTGSAMKRLAKLSGVSDLAAATALDYARGAVVDLLRHFNPATGNELTTIAPMLSARESVSQVEATVQGQAYQNAISTARVGLSNYVTPAAAPTASRVSATAPPSQTSSHALLWDVVLGVTVVAAAGSLWWYSRRS